MKSLLTAVVFLVVLAFAGCGKQESTPREVMPAQAKDPGGVLDTLLSKKKTVTFVSRSGKFYGMDSDTELTFLPDRKVHLVEYGYAVSKYDGVYTADAEGVISLQLDNRRSPWPPMVLQFANGDYYLNTKSGASGFVMGDRAGATETSEMKPFWPFRLVEEGIPLPNQTSEPTLMSVTPPATQEPRQP